MASILHLVDPKAWFKILQFSCRFKGNNTVTPNHQQNGDVNGAHQLVIFRVWRRKNVKRIYSVSLLSKTGRNLTAHVANGSFACPELEF